MLSWLANAWRVPELRRRLLFTALILALYRMGSWMPAPGVDSAQIQNFFNGRGGSLLGLLNLFSGSALSRFSIFALGIMPYVTASIILQLLTVVIPTLEQLQKEGESGYAKINQYTRYLTVVLAAAQATGYAYLFHTQGALPANPGRLVLIVVTLTSGTVLLMWLGELITKRGIGNGISLLIFASILTAAPQGINAWINGGAVEKLFFPLIALGVVFFIGQGAWSGAWLSFLGWFLLQAATAEGRYGLLRDALGGLCVRDAMVRMPVTVAADASLDEFMDGVAHEHRFTTYPVVDDGRVVGLLRFAAVAHVSRDAWTRTRVRDCMLPFDDVPQLLENEPLVDAIGHPTGRLIERRAPYAVDLDTVRAELLAAVQRAVQPSSASIWIR